MEHLSTSEPTVPSIGEALRFVQMSGIFYCPSELTEPWGIELPPMDGCVWFHAVVRGSCTLDVGGERLTLSAGDLVVVPHGAGHRAWGAAAAPTPNVLTLPHDEISETYAILRHGGGGDRTDIVCGGIRFDHPAARHLASALPAVIHIEAAQTARSDWMRATLDLLADETRNPRTGSDAIVSRLCDIVVIQAIRSWVETDPAARTGWLGALRDEQIGAAIALIHSAPQEDWSVASLAECVAMSRSAFAERFTRLVGESVMQYVTRWRVHVALDLLESSDDTVASIADAVGYGSEAAFSRAFKRAVGVSPTTIRDRASRPSFVLTSNQAPVASAS